MLSHMIGTVKNSRSRMLDAGLYIGGEMGKRSFRFLALSRLAGPINTK